MSCETFNECTACSCGQCARLRRQQRKQQLCTLYAQSVYQLPSELVLHILDHVELVELPNTVSAMYHLIAVHGIVPKLPQRELQWARGLLNWPMPLISTVPFFSCRSPHRLPVELSLEIQRYLSPQDKVNFVLAVYGIPSGP